jgi:hypothetical protein
MKGILKMKGIGQDVLMAAIIIVRWLGKFESGEFDEKQNNCIVSLCRKPIPYDE